MIVLRKDTSTFLKTILIFSFLSIGFNSQAVDIYQGEKKIDLSNSSKTISDSPSGSVTNLPANDELYSTTPKNYTSTSTSDSPATSDLGASTAGTGEKQSIEANKPPSKFPDIMQACMFQSTMAQEALSELCKKSAEGAKTCSERFVPAGTLCNPDTNANVLQQAALIQTLMSTAQGLTDACSTFSKAMTLGKAAMTAYTSICSVQRKMCDSSCSSSLALVKQVGQVAKSIQPKLATTSCVPNSPTASQCTPETNDKERVNAIINLVNEEVQETAPTVASKLKTCAIDMTTLLGLGLANIVGLAQAKGASDQCDKQTAANDSKPADVAAKDTTVDCGLAANADKPVCICKANPRIKGCEGISTALATNSTLSNGGSGSTSGKGVNTAGGSLTAANDKKFPANLATASKNDGSGGSGFGGGSNAGLTGSSDGTSNPESQLAKNGAVGNANILGTESGGGGGYRFGFGSGSSAKTAGRNIATSDRVKGKLSAMDWSNQVTSNAGKSNFDKIKVRYNENRTSLLNR